MIGTPVGIASASLSLTFSLSTGIVKELLKTTRNKKKKHNKIIMLARSKLDSIEGKVSEASINNEVSHEDFLVIINEEKNYRELKESIRMMNKSDSEKINLVKEGKKIGIDEVIKRDEVIKNNLKYQIQYKTMLPYCLKCKKKNTESINPKVSKTANGKTMMLSKCAVCDSKKSKFIKEQQAKGLLSNLSIRTPLNKIPLLGDILF